MKTGGWIILAGVVIAIVGVLAIVAAAYQPPKGGMESTQDLVNICAGFTVGVIGILVGIVVMAFGAGIIIASPKTKTRSEFLSGPDASKAHANRDGSSPEMAIIVGRVPEEYAWMQRHCPGFQLQCQSLQEIDGKPFDVLELKNERGEERTVYFDISSFFGKF